MSFTSVALSSPRVLYIKCTTCFSRYATRFCVICVTEKTEIKQCMLVMPHLFFLHISNSQSAHMGAKKEPDCKSRAIPCI